MAYDEKILHRSLARYNEDRRRRAEAFAAHRQQIFREIITSLTFLNSSNSCKIKI